MKIMRNLAARTTLGYALRFGAMGLAALAAGSCAKNIRVQQLDNGNLAWRAPQIPNSFNHLALMAVDQFWPTAQITLPQTKYTEFTTFVESELTRLNPNTVFAAGQTVDSFELPKNAIDIKLKDLLGSDPANKDALAQAKNALKESKAKVADLEKQLSKETAKSKEDPKAMQGLRTQLKAAQNAAKAAQGALETARKSAEDAAQKAQEETAKFQLELEKAKLKGQEVNSLRQGQKLERSIDIIDARATITAFNQISFAIVNAQGTAIGKVTVDEKKSNLEQLIFALTIILDRDAAVGVAQLRPSYPIMVEDKTETITELLQALRVEVLEARQRAEAIEKAEKRIIPKKGVCDGKVREKYVADCNQQCTGKTGSSLSKCIGKYQ